MSDNIERLVGTREISRLSDRGSRQIYNLRKQGKFPEPDVPGGRGVPNRWYMSTVRKALADLEAHAKSAATTAHTTAVDAH